ncbi:MAG: HIT domain-containing protein [Chloroflexi bacterium]|nr:HIT domain-containing protein [Chloroflexota bacterium]
MKRIWSPWRMQYILEEKPSGCVFCVKPAEQDDPENLILLRGQHCYVMMNRYPYNNGHLMVIPYEHVDLPTKLCPAAQLELMTQTGLCIEVLQDAMHPDGFNVGMNLGASAGAGIKDHVHIHVVPRWTGDTNFMPVLGDTRVIVEGLQESYAKLRPRFADRCDVPSVATPSGSARPDSTGGGARE